ncbi:PadR family transcriptional regulator [Aeromicrobium camelliae]|uniref:PadR family transcriptional regulator n=1 Tax=Aeromicrobium camelliae TaxID=1538144 RepID=A0A3N6WPX1_9ACTN|nr:PadR family transcriptional regulator [Aeromicrobium camelliae]RQN09350.1 PadR family transcriptional regulator [Aeromicrobium camelliae]
MALEHAILVSLTEQAATGYDLARRFDASIGYFWRASHQQIYKTLARMEADGWVSATIEPREGTADKKTYAITDAGREELTRFTAEPSPREALRSDFAVKLRGLADVTAIVEDTRRRRADHVERLDRYEASAKRHYPDPDAVEERERGAYLALRGGILSERMGIAWCDEILDQLETRSDR